MAQKQVSELQVKTILKPKIRQFKKIKTNSLKDKKKSFMLLARLFKKNKRQHKLLIIRNRRGNITSYPTNIMFT